MAIQSQPSRIPEPFAGSGTKNTIPATNATPSASQAASWASGFPPECSQPISAGGCPVPRNDVNGALNQLSQDFVFRQDGGIWEWSALADYDTQRMVRGSDGLLYWSVAQSGPGFGAGAVDPTTDDGTYWVSPKIRLMDSSDNSDCTVSSKWVRNWYASIELSGDMYVDAVNGDNSNNGQSPGTAVKTFGGLLNILNSTLVIKPQTINVHVASGTYSDSPDGVPGANIVYDFASGAIITPTMSVSGGKTIYLTGILTTKGPVQVGVDGNIFFGSSSKSLDLTFDNLGSTGYAIYVNGGAISRDYSSPSVSIKFSGTNTFSAAVLSVTSLGLSRWLKTGGTTTTWTVLSGASVTGKRYQATACSVISSVGGPNVIPGTTAGTIDTTSYFS